MKIAIVHSFYSSASPSGENNVVEAQISALRENGHDVLLIDRHTDVESRKKLYRAKAMLRAAHLTGPTPTPILRKFEPDIVHIHNLFPNWGVHWIGDWAPKVVTTLHNYRPVCASGLLWRDGHVCTECLDYGSQRSLLHKCYRDSRIATLPLALATRKAGQATPVLQKSKTLIVLNEQARNAYAEILPKADIQLIPNFVGSESEWTGKPSADWLYVGRLTEEKGINWILAHWPDDLHLKLVGSGPLAGEVASKAIQYPNKFTYLGQLENSETRDLIRGSAGLIIPSLWSEGIPTVALEALQAGTPIAISSQCASAPQLSGGGAGLVFSTEDDGKNLNQVVHEIQEQQELMRPAARRLYEIHYSESVWLEKIERLYGRILVSS